MRIVIGLWSKNTREHSGSARELRQALRAFSARMWSIVAASNDVNNNNLAGRMPSTQDLLGIFVAPEYYRGRPQASDDPDGYTAYMEDREKEVWLQELCDLSEMYPSVLIVPGTVLWRKPVARRERFDNRGRVLPDKPRSRLDKAREALQIHQTWMTAAEERGLQNRLVNRLTDNEWLQAKQGLLTDDPGRLRYVLRNTAYVLFDGRVMLKYNKCADYGEIGFHSAAVAPDGTMFIPGMAWGYFSLLDLNFAMEVCFDHPQGYGVMCPGPAPDVQILASAAVPTDVARLYVREGGVFLHASSEDGYTEILQRTNTGTARIPFTFNDAVNGATLHVAPVDIP